MTSESLEAIEGGVRLHVHAQPGAKRTEFAGTHGGAMKIRIHAPPVDGKANEELIRFLADWFGLAKSNVRLSRGEKSRAKTFELLGIDVEFARSRLA